MGQKATWAIHTRGTSQEHQNLTWLGSKPQPPLNVGTAWQGGVLYPGKGTPVPGSHHTHTAPPSCMTPTSPSWENVYWPQRAPGLMAGYLHKPQQFLGTIGHLQQEARAEPWMAFLAQSCHGLCVRGGPRPEAAGAAHADAGEDVHQLDQQRLPARPGECSRGCPAAHPCCPPSSLAGGPGGLAEQVLWLSLLETPQHSGGQCSFLKAAALDCTSRVLG